MYSLHFHSLPSSFQTQRSDEPHRLWYFPIGRISICHARSQHPFLSLSPSPPPTPLLSSAAALPSISLRSQRESWIRRFGDLASRLQRLSCPPPPLAHSFQHISCTFYFSIYLVYTCTVSVQWWISLACLFVVKSPVKKSQAACS